MHLFISILPKITICKLVQLIKDRTAHKLMRSSPALQKQYLERPYMGRWVFLPSKRKCHRRCQLPPRLKPRGLQESVDEGKRYPTR
ncbi:MAG: transposase [Deltaproteobacteria bacterium]|nr:transposase [Deltaproteobacteria bacterium]